MPGLLALFALLLTLAPAARAEDDVARFYKGRTVTCYVGYGVGGAYDLYAREIGKFLGRHIPGEPKVAVENISAGYHTLAEAFSGWRDSPPHRANMLKDGVTRIGIAAVYTPNSKYKVFWALILATPDDGTKG